MALLSPTPVLFPPLELNVATSPRSDLRMAIDATVLRWDELEVRLDDLTAIAYAARARRRLGVVRRVSRTIRLWQGDRPPVVIDLHGGTLARSLEGPQLAAYGAITSALYAAAEPRLRAELLRRIATGDRVQLGPWTLDARGISDDTGLSVGWDQLPTAVLDGEFVAITHRREGGGVDHRRLSMLTPNAVLLPELLDEAAVVFA